MLPSPGLDLLVYLLGRKIWEGPKGKGGFYFHCLFVCFRQTETRVLPKSVVWFGCVFGSRWMWFGCRGPEVGAGDLDAVLHSGTGLVWPRANFSTTLGHFFCSFASLGL